MNRQFAPTPWTITQHGFTLTIFPVSNKKATIATVYAPEYRMAEGEANAQLILTAPELLDALGELVDYCETKFFMDTHITREPRVMQNARAAIAKALGVSSI